MDELLPDALRALIRELLGEVLAASHLATSATEVREVRITDDASLATFIAELLDLAESPQRRAEIREGKVRFHFVGGADAAAATPGTGSATVATAAAVTRIERGALTEKAVVAAAKNGQSIRLGRKAVATPLALERARSLGVDLQKEAE